MAAIEAELVERVAEPARQPRPGVVEAIRPVGQPEPGEVDRDRAQSLIGQPRDQLAIQERAGRHAVEQHNGGPVALFADEAAHPAGVEPAPGGAVGLDQLQRPRSFTARIITATSAKTRRTPSAVAESAARLVASVPLTRSREARKGRAWKTQPERVVLDRDDLRRTLVRIAHEIVEKNPGAEPHRRCRHPHPRAPFSAAACTPWSASSPAPRCRSATSTSPSTATTSPTASPARSRSSTARTSTSTSTAAPSSSSTTSCSPAAPRGRRSTRCSTTDGPSASSSPCSPTAATASCRSAPTTSARTCRPRATSASTSASRRSDGIDEVAIERVGHPAPSGVSER